MARRVARALGAAPPVARQRGFDAEGGFRGFGGFVVRGEGCNLFDAAGRRYLDLMGGIATVALRQTYVYPSGERRSASS